MISLLLFLGHIETQVIVKPQRRYGIGTAMALHYAIPTLDNGIAYL